MAIKLKNAEQIDKLYASGQIVREVLDRLGEIIALGITTEDLDAEAGRICRMRGAKCLFKGVASYCGGEPFSGRVVPRAGSPFETGTRRVALDVCGPWLRGAPFT